MPGPFSLSLRSSIVAGLVRTAVIAGSSALALVVGGGSWWALDRFFRVYSCFVIFLLQKE